MKKAKKVGTLWYAKVACFNNLLKIKIMKKFKNTLLVITALFMLAFTFSCSSSDDEKAGCDNFETAITEATDTYSSAIHAYYANQTPENCAKLKSETTNFIAVYNDYLDCIPESEQDNIQEQIRILQETVNEYCK